MAFVDIAVQISLSILGLSFFLALGRVVIGPTIPDRVVALDLIAFLMIGFIAVYCISVEDPVYLNAPIVLALVVFLSTIAIARYLERPVNARLDE